MNYKIIISSAFITILLANCKGEEKKKKVLAETKQSIETAVVEKASFSENIKLPAQLLAYQEVSIYPKVNGYVKNVLVDIGSFVKQGQLLMVLEAPELQQLSLQAKEKYARTMSDFAISKERYMRLKQASLTEGAVSPLDLAVAKAKGDADSTLARAEKANWDMQEIMQGYLRVTAPFSGIITERNVHPGALVSAVTKDKPMLELKEIQHLRLAVDVPEALAATLKLDDEVSFYLSSSPGKPMTARISRMSHNLNLQYRSEKIELDVPNANTELSSGMYADVVFKSKPMPNALSVPKSAIVTNDKSKYVMLLKDNKTVKADVVAGIETGNKIQVYGPLTEGDKVVINPDAGMEEGRVVDVH